MKYLGYIFCQMLIGYHFIMLYIHDIHEYFRIATLLGTQLKLELLFEEVVVSLFYGTEKMNNYWASMLLKCTTQ